MSRTNSLCIFSERQDVALELCTAGRTLVGDGSLVAVVVGADAEQAARELLAHGVDHAYIAESSELAVLKRTAVLREPGVVLVGAMVHGTEIASRLAQSLGVG